MSGASFSDFVTLGLEHIFTGYDHLFFLFGLLLVCANSRELISIITCFTVGHSLTLALATLNLVHLSPRITEPLIALTILIVGVENFWRRSELPKRRWILTLLFGLVHGFGFATVLRELGVGTNGKDIVRPLLGFNCGVEIGQLIFAALILPIFWWARTKPVFARQWVPALSAAVALAGLYWLIERIVFA